MRIGAFDITSTIRCKAPLRLGLAGGGTDLSPFCDVHGGAILNCTIDRFAYAFIAPHHGGRLVFRARDLLQEEEHEPGSILPTDSGLRLHRCVYNHFLEQSALDPAQGMVVTTAVDAPAGSGLGSSSALVVAMCEAFSLLCDAPMGLYDVGHLAFEIERNRLHLAGGKQDHYAAAFGGVNFIEFLSNDRVIVNPLRIARPILNELEASLALCFTGASRESARIIEQQMTNMQQRNGTAVQALLDMKADALEMKQALLVGDISAMAKTLATSWTSKQKTSSSVSNSAIDALFEVGLQAGAKAGKISGAGGGGFLMFLIDPENRLELINALNRAGGQASPTHLTSTGVEAWRQPKISGILPNRRFRKR